MGIDIYLGGFDAFEQRTAHLKAEFEEAMRVRDLKHKNRGYKDIEQTEEQRRVHAAYEALHCGRSGYIRSSYNSAGLFNVLEEIFGFDVAAYLFPGEWSGEVEVDGDEFCKRVKNLQAVTVEALNRGHLSLPWTELFSQITGERAPDPNRTRLSGEEFGKMVRSLIEHVGKFDVVTPESREESPVLMPDHQWYLTTGLGNLYDFGELAMELKAKGERTFAYISC